ncbi:hypothetical protein BJ998_008917 [Kutzneria kofuensis]|uniref:Peptidoglycan binding protein n=1 Tax=Kutzneria kofuensis TaxID=103725 RepID=A0A7W9KRY8_9PSEU|nr:hypothetical protein [Kutzneria kofuensis]
MIARSPLVIAALLIVFAGVCGGAAVADPSKQDWARLRMCESSDSYTAVSADGKYYGAYQFDLPTWASVGGTGLPSEASPAEQDYRALYLYRMRGWQPWECSLKLGLTPDTDAASRRVPTTADAAYIAVPIWPGKVYLAGDCAPALAIWQQRMATFGYLFRSAGCYDGATRQAVHDLQAANDITITGQLGRLTWKAAWLGNPPLGVG